MHSMLLHGHFTNEIKIEHHEYKKNEHMTAGH